MSAGAIRWIRDGDGEISDNPDTDPGFSIQVFCSPALTCSVALID